MCKREGRREDVELLCCGMFAEYLKLCGEEIKRSVGRPFCIPAFPGELVRLPLVRPCYILKVLTALSNQNSRTFQGKFVTFQGMKITEVEVSALFGSIHI